MAQKGLDIVVHSASQPQLGMVLNMRNDHLCGQLDPAWVLNIGVGVWYDCDEDWPLARENRMTAVDFGCVDHVLPESTNMQHVMCGQMFIRKGCLNCERTVEPTKLLLLPPEYLKEVLLLRLWGQSSELQLDINVPIDFLQRMNLLQHAMPSDGDICPEAHSD